MEYTSGPSIAMDLLRRRGVELEPVARLVEELQRPYVKDLTFEDCLASVRAVLAKREVQYAVITGVILDEMAEEGSLKEPLGSLVRGNHRLYGIDAMLALAIVNMYGSIGMSNYGFLAENKGYLFRNLEGRHNKVNTFLDDLVSAVVAAACARIAHRKGMPPSSSPSPVSSAPAEEPGGSEA